MSRSPAFWSRDRRPLPALLVGVLLLGATESMIGPYLVLYGAQRMRLSAFEIGLFVSLTAVSGMVVSLWFGRRYDNRPSRRPALAAGAAAGVGYLLLTATTSYPLMLLIGALFLGAGSAAFPQLFALSRSHTDGGAGASGGGIPVLRSAWSLAWAVGPLAGGALLSWQGFTGLLLATGLGFGLVIVAVLKVKAPPPASPGPDQEVRTARSGHMRPLVPAIVAFTLFHTAMFSGSVALPLYVTEELGRPAGEVGLMFSVCALVEIPAALGLMLLPPGVRKDRVILLGMGLFVLYFVLVVAATGVVALVLVQLARGVAIAVVGALGITYFQDQLPGAAGRSTTLFANTATAGSLVSGIAAGAVAQALGYRAALVACAVLSVLAWSLFFLARRRGQPLPL